MINELQDRYHLTIAGATSGDVYISAKFEVDRKSNIVLDRIGSHLWSQG